MGEPTSSATTAWFILKFLVITLTPFIAPQLAGMLGGVAYLIVRHELNMASLSLKSVLIVMFFGWLGAWATVNILAEYENVTHVWVQVSSASVGFLMYDAMLFFGANTTSVIEFFWTTLKTTLTKAVDKWNS